MNPFDYKDEKEALEYLKKRNEEIYERPAFIAVKRLEDYDILIAVTCRFENENQIIDILDVYGHVYTSYNFNDRKPELRREHKVNVTTFNGDEYAQETLKELEYIVTQKYQRVGE